VHFHFISPSQSGARGFVLELTFITTSKIKRAHAEYLCQHYAVRIGRQRNYGVGYQEPHIFEREVLLEQSIEDALLRWKKNISNPDERFFFIEDTSVIVHALSDRNHEVPGVDVKFWMQENDFTSIDRQLKARGNDRSVTVQSDVLLTLSSGLEGKTGKKFIRFTSQTKGRIAEGQYEFDTNPLYPWLDNKTFNKWFVPDGCNAPISMLPIEEANKFDFRAGAFEKMLLFLKEHDQISKKDEARRKAPMVQPSLPIGPYLFIVSGPTCAGKTTLAEYMVRQFGYFHIEASDFMYLSYYEKHGVGSSVGIANFALQALREKPSIVADKILDFLMSLGRTHVVITGFRAKEEIECFKRHYKGHFPLKIILVDADTDVRLERYLVRNRGGGVTEDQFKDENQLQKQIGLSELMMFPSGVSIQNNQSFDSFYADFEQAFDEGLANLKALDIADAVTPKHLEDAILLAMGTDQEHFYTTAEIAKLINEALGITKSKNNVSRYFNQRFHPFFEIRNIDGVNRHRLSQTGMMQALWLKTVEK